MLKKSTIVALAGCLIIGGIGLSVAGLALGGRTSISFPFNEFNNDIETGVVGKRASVNEGIESFQNMDIDVGTVALNIVTGDTYKIEIDMDKSVDLEYRVSKDTLYIQQNHTSARFNLGVGGFNSDFEGTVTVTIPKDVKLSKVDIELGVGAGLIKDIQTRSLEMIIGVASTKIQDVVADDAVISGGVGKLEIDRLTSEKAEITGGVGEIDAYNLVSNALEAGIGVGQITLQGDIKGDIDIEGGVGSLALILEGKESDYNYYITRGGGNILINDNEHFGMEDVTIKNGARHDVEIDAGLGGVKIKTAQ